MTDERLTLSEWMRRIAARPRQRRQQLQVTCEVCGVTFTAAMRTRKHCSNRCSSRAYRQRQRQQRQAGGS